MRDCRNCKHNGYDRGAEWVLCVHPITLRKGPHWEKGDPAFVNMRTADLPISRIAEVADCPTWDQSDAG